MIDNEELMNAWQDHLKDWLDGKCKLMSWVDFAAQFLSKHMATVLVNQLLEDEKIQGELHARD